MAIYHCSTKPISRSSGRSATASSAYRSAQKIVDKQTGEIHDYTKKQGVAYTEIITPKNINIDEVTREDLWNLAEQTEKRKDARVSREFVIALPHEISRERQIEVAKEFSQYLSDRYTIVADLAIHEPSKYGNDKNIHAHIMITTRKAEMMNGKLQLTEKTDLELSNSKRKSIGLKATQEDIKEIREKWADVANRALKKEGVDIRIDHRSYADQEKEQIPTKHEGVTVTELRRKGQIIGVAKLNEEIKEENRIIKSIKVEEQQNHKPTFLERIGLKKAEKIEKGLPTISEIINHIDKKIEEAEQLKLQTSHEKFTVENVISPNIRVKEHEENEKQIAGSENSQYSLENEYKQVVYGNPNQRVTSFDELLKMNRFIAEVEIKGNKIELLESLKQKNSQIIEQPISQSKPIVEPKLLAIDNHTENNHIELKTPEKTEQASSIKEEFKKNLLEVRKQSKIRENITRQSVKIKNSNWDMDR